MERTGAGLVDIAQDVGHASLVCQERSQVRRLLRVILGEGLDLAAMAHTPLLWKEAERAVPGPLEFTVRHGT